jgi:transposase
VFVDTSYSPAKRLIASERPNAEGGAKWLAARVVREFHLHAEPKVLRLLRSRWSKEFSTKSRSGKNRRRWKIERTISWISSFRPLVIRREYFSFIYQGFIHLACILICLRRF